MAEDKIDRLAAILADISDALRSYREALAEAAAHPGNFEAAVKAASAFQARFQERAASLGGPIVDAMLSEERDHGIELLREFGDECGASVPHAAVAAQASAPPERPYEADEFDTYAALALESERAQAATPSAEELDAINRQRFAEMLEAQEGNASKTNAMAPEEAWKRAYSSKSSVEIVDSPRLRPAGDDAIAKLAARFKSGDHVTVADDDEASDYDRRRKVDAERVDKMLQDAGRIRELDSMAAAFEAFGRFGSLFSNVNLRIAADWPQDWNHAFTSLGACWARYLQDHPNIAADDIRKNRLKRKLACLASHAKTSQPEFVYGLAHHHEPPTGSSWLQEAQRHYNLLRSRISDWTPLKSRPSERSERPRWNEDDALRRLCEAVGAGESDGDEALALEIIAEVVAEGGDLNATRFLNAVEQIRDLVEERDDLSDVARALRNRDKEDAATAHNERFDLWPHQQLTAGKRAVIVGGARMAERLDAIKDAFEFAEVEWQGTRPGCHAKADSLRQRMINGNVDYVIALQPFVGHMWTNLIFKEKDGPAVAMLSEGYGIGQLRRAFERFVVKNEDAAE